VVDLDAAFGQQLLDVAIRTVVAQIAHHHRDHLGREAEANERRPRHRPQTPAG
jgi:hypothetical protein